MNVYSIFDKIKGNSIAIFMAENDGLAVRENAPAFSRVIPLGDLALYCIGSFDTKTQEFKAISPVVVDWDSYKFPETPLPIVSQKGGKK